MFLGVRRQAWGWLASIVLPVIIYVVLHDIPYQARVTIAITVGALALWVFEPIPFAMTSILVLALYPVMHAVSLDTMLSGYGAPAIFLIVAGMMMAKGIQATSLGERVAYLLLYWLGNKRGGILAGVILVPQVMAFFIPAAAVRTTMFLPIALSLLSLLKIPREHPMTRQLMMGVAVGCSISGVGVLPAAIGNVISVDLIQQYLHQRVTYTDWLVIAGPIWVLLIPFCWWILWITFPAHLDNQEDIRGMMKEKMKDLGPLSLQEKKAIVILVLAFVLWMLEPLHGWPSAIPAILAAFVMALPKVGIVEWDKMVKVDFGTILLLGATLSLGRALMESGAVEVIIKRLNTPVVDQLFTYPVLAVLVVSVLTQLIHKVTTNVSTAVIAVVPIVIAISQEVGASAYILTITAGINALLGFVLVVETIPNVITHASGLITQRDFFRCGFWLTLCSLGIIVLVAVTWWKWLQYV
jgi:anion transporter